MPNAKSPPTIGSVRRSIRLQLFQRQNDRADEHHEQYQPGNIEGRAPAISRLPANRSTITAAMNTKRDVDKEDRLQPKLR